MDEQSEYVMRKHNDQVATMDKSYMSDYPRRLLRMIQKYDYIMTTSYDSRQNKTTCAIKRPTGKDQYGYEVWQTVVNIQYSTAEILEPFLYMHECIYGEHSRFDNDWVTHFYKYGSKPTG